MVKYEYSTGIAKVYHIGNHKCWPQITTDSAQLLSLVQKPVKRKGSAKDVAIEEILEFIDKGDMDGAEREAEAWVDRRKVKRTIESLKPMHGSEENSFDTVAELKKKTDEKDKYYIYQLGNKKYGNTVDHVFKSSKKMAQMAIEMDVDREENILQLENAYFDATHSRVQNFKSLGMWLVHPAMKKILRLASMEIRSEHHEDIALFLTLFNKILAEVTGIPGYKFNPRYFVCDEARANYKAIALVYGEEFAAQRVKGCQWHFKSDVQKHIKHVRPVDQDRFVDTCFKMCEVTTVADYNCLKAILDEMSEESPEIKPFINYWHPRRSHVFRPFRGGGLPGVNLSEQANKSFKPSSSKAMHLVTAAKYDAATMVLQEREIDMFLRNFLKAPGRGVSRSEKIARDHAEQMKIAQDFANIFDNIEDVLMEAEEANNPSMYIPKAQSSFRAPKVKRTSKNGERGRGRGRGGRGRVKRSGQKKGKDNPEGMDGNKDGGGQKDSGGQKETGEEDMEALLEEKIILAMDVTGSELITERKNKVDNPPVIIIASWRITQCKGCKKGISKEDKKYPHNLVIRRRGVYGYFNPHTKMWSQDEANIHFHLDMKCLRKNDPSLEKRHFVCNDEDFCKLDRAQMEVLHDGGFLKPIAEKKME